MKIVCDACGAKYSIADEKVAGKVFKIRCKKCSNIIVVRGNEGAEAAEAAPAAEPAKDTKVFDYQGYDSPQDAMAAAHEGEWHLVIDQEQVGPMTSEEVRQRFAAGEVDADSYIWKEGFDDWKRIPEVDEFADLEASADAGAAAGGGLFGGDDAGDSGASTDDGGLFGGGASGAGSDLFGDAAAASAGSDLFGGGGGGDVGDTTGEVPMSAEAEAQLKGQRNENSVLFSLGNLAALASDSPKPAASTSPSSSSKPVVSNTGGSEGSGLIDIRSMASVYLADKGSAAGPVSSTPTGSADDLPVFSQSEFGGAAPVLLPVQQSGPDKKLLYTLVGVIGALVVAAAVLVVIVLSGGDDDKKDEPAVAANNVAENTAGSNAAANTAGDNGTPTEGTPTEATAAGGTDTASEETADPTPPEGGTDETPTEEPPKSDDGDKGSSRSSRGDRKSSDRRDRERNKPRDSKPKPEPKPDPKPTSSGGGGCDEVTCLVEPNKACCKKFNKGGSSSKSSSSSSNSNLPAQPSRGDITSGIGKVKGRVTSCGDKHGGSGTVKVKIKIGSDGKVKSATASGGSSQLRSCVTSAVKRAKFPKTQKGATVNYPFVFR